jgi:DNA polymerase III subunit epsilon
MSRLTLRRPVCGATPEVLAQRWRDVDYCSVDFETTGLDLRRDSIVSYGAVTVRGGRVMGSSAVYALARPNREPSPSSVAIHTLRAVDCAEAPGDRETGHALSVLLEDKVLVAHAAWIETTLLKRYLAKVGRRPSPLVVDTAALARALDLAPYQGNAEPSLEWLAHQLRLPGYTPHHALGDAMTTAIVFVALASRLGVRQPDLTAADLIRFSDKYRRA